MNRFRTTARQSGPDDGIAMVVAVAVMSLVSILMVVMITVAVHEAQASGRDRQRSSAVMTAEGQVDATIAKIQSVTPTTLPCGALAPVSSTVGRDRMTITTTVTYYAASGAAVDCANKGATTLTQAKVVSTSTSVALAGQPPAKRTVESLVGLTATVGTSLNKAIFGSGGIGLEGSGDVNPEPGKVNADVYTNGDFTCRNGEQFFGSIYVQGKFSAEECNIKVDVFAKGNVSNNNDNSTYGGNITSSQGTVSLGKARTVTGTIKSRGTATWKTSAGAEQCTSSSTKCVANQTTLADPPAEAFPQLKWTAATQQQWIDGGFVNVVTIPSGTMSCDFPGTWGVPQNSQEFQKYNGQVDGVGYWLISRGPSLTVPTILRSTCPNQAFTQMNNGQLVLGADLALVTNGGFKSANQLTISGTATAGLPLPRNFYVIQPADAPNTTSCSGTNAINLNNGTTVTASVRMLLYTPCSILKENREVITGQVYAGGRVDVRNYVNITYAPLPIFGITTSGGAVKYYSTAILYKRENIG